MAKMNCSGCVGNITRVLQAFAGVDIMGTDLPTKTVQIRYDSERVQLAEIEQALANAKYPVASVSIAAKSV
ncbi:hypothetical protein KDA_71510 [Dictyobacter alpinus]|uniref:HMA domain-containing protein n=2 Tax=Dictyobacter alpinus TaxID=2014873 RepID=A0A402BJY5_9CHLR|nr:hypothetical protein KDA_71510 [Dictyobacter alpinus]